jgi:hypothetical protein
VAALAEAEQDFWLRKAEEHRWPVKRLRGEVSASLAERSAGRDDEAGLDDGAGPGGGEGGWAVLRVRVPAGLLETCQTAADTASLSIEAWTTLALEHAAQGEPLAGRPEQIAVNAEEVVPPLSGYVIEPADDIS